MEDSTDRASHLRRDELRAFDELYDRLNPRLYRFLARLSGDPAVAQDLLQETWLAFARHEHHLDHDEDVAAWLFTVARNRYRSWRRWAMFDFLRTDRLRALPISYAHAADEDHVLAETQQRLEVALQRLSPALREVLLLVVVEGLDTSQVASVLEIQPEAVRQRLSRARSQLADFLHAMDRTVAPGQVKQGAEP